METGKSTIKVKVPEGLMLPDDYLVFALSHDKEERGGGRKSEERVVTSVLTKVAIV